MTRLKYNIRNLVPKALVPGQSFIAHLLHSIDSGKKLEKKNEFSIKCDSSWLVDNKRYCKVPCVFVLINHSTCTCVSGASCSKHRLPNGVVKTSIHFKYMPTTLSKTLVFV